LSGDGGTLYAANFENDSVSLVDTKTRQVVSREVFATPGGKKAMVNTLLDCPCAWIRPKAPTKCL